MGRVYSWDEFGWHLFSDAQNRAANWNVGWCDECDCLESDHHPLAAWLLEDPFFDQPPCWLAPLLIKYFSVQNDDARIRMVLVTSDQCKPKICWRPYPLMYAGHPKYGVALSEVGLFEIEFSPREIAGPFVTIPAAMKWLAIFNIETHADHLRPSDFGWPVRVGEDRSVGKWDRRDDR